MMQYTLAHEPLPGEHLPRPCPRCDFCHDESTAACEYKEETEMREKLRADDSKAGRAKYARWQTERAKRHLNIRAGPEGLSVLRQATRRPHLCHHHVVRLNLPKAPWKLGLLMNLSDDGREKVQGTLAEYGFSLDLRTNRMAPTLRRSSSAEGRGTASAAAIRNPPVAQRPSPSSCSSCSKT